MWVFIKFDLTDMSYHAWIALVISVVFSLILGPIFMYMLEAIIAESMNFVKISFRLQNQYKWMLDSMQVGTVVIAVNSGSVDDDEVTFMNELCQKLMTYVARSFHYEDF